MKKARKSARKTQHVRRIEFNLGIDPIGSEPNPAPGIRHTFELRDGVLEEPEEYRREDYRCEILIGGFRPELRKLARWLRR